MGGTSSVLQGYYRGTTEPALRQQVRVVPPRRMVQQRQLQVRRQLRRLLQHRLIHAGTPTRSCVRYVIMCACVCACVCVCVWWLLQTEWRSAYYAPRPSEEHEAYAIQRTMCGARQPRRPAQAQGTEWATTSDSAVTRALWSCRRTTRKHEDSRVISAHRGPEGAIGVQSARRGVAGGGTGDAAESPCRCGSGEPSPGADVAGCGP